MKCYWRYRAANKVLAVGLLAAPLAVFAQATSAVQASDWRQANNAVGALKRGHADILQWEEANLPPSPPSVVPKGPALASAEAAVRMAWRVHPELARPLAQLGPQNVQWIAQGQWTELDPSLQRRIADAAEVLEVAAAGRKAWIEAVAAQQVLRHHQEMAEAAQAAYALGQRMVTVGNWSMLQMAPVRLAAANARMNLRRAQLAAALAQAKLVKAMGQTGLVESFVIPEQLPAIPDQPMAAEGLHKRAEAIRNQLPGAEGLRNRALSRLAMDIYGTAHALAQDSQQNILKTREFITEETLLHYNGMLKSVWDLLSEVRNQSQAAVNAIGAQRDFWLAEADLQWVLQGGEPKSFVTLGGASGEDAAAAAAH